MSKAKRPSISISAATYAKLRAFCDLNNISMASLVETRVLEYIDAQPENLLDVQPVEGDRP